MSNLQSEFNCTQHLPHCREQSLPFEDSEIFCSNTFLHLPATHHPEHPSPDKDLWRNQLHHPSLLKQSSQLAALSPSATQLSHPCTGTSSLLHHLDTMAFKHPASIHRGWCSCSYHPLNAPLLEALTTSPLCVCSLWSPSALSFSGSLLSNH